MLGAQAVAKAFPEYPTTIVRVTPPAVHLKDYVSMAGPEVMAVGRSEAAQQTFLVNVLLYFTLLLARMKTMPFEVWHSHFTAQMC